MKIYLVKLLYISSNYLNNLKLKPEQREAIRFADKLRYLTLSGRLNAVWFHVPNEGKRSKYNAALLKASGLIPGVADFVFIMYDKVVLLELKVGANKQTTNQEYFGQWCKDCGVSYHVFYSVEDGINILKNEGFLDGRGKI